ncbi:O-antigen ligase family protein [Halomonas sp. ANAO-440]|nr:O-antigen ligase family protein [Halomonas sp. ANAO-440]
MLLLGSMVLLVRRSTLALSRQDWMIISALVAYALVGIAEAWWDEQGARGIDKPVRFLLAIPAMLLILAYPPRLTWMWSGIALGAIGAGGWAGWQKLAEGVDRASGYTFVIQFGNLSMLLGILCLAGMGWAVVQPHRRAWVLLLALGAAAGVMGSLFSGSRGGWIGIPVVLLVLYKGYGRQLSARLKLVAIAVVMAGSVAAVAIPQTGVKHRIEAAVSDVSQYVTQNNPVTSVGARFEMWKGASYLVAEKPLLGWGHNGYQQGMGQLAERGVIHSGVLIYGHAHNEFIDALAKRGLLGLAVLLALYLIPMRLFARHLAAVDLRLRSLAVAGVLLPVAYIDFGLSQVFLGHNSGVMMYAFWLAVLWGGYSNYLKEKEK